jgi:GT2 family glycosyltransferase
MPDAVAAAILNWNGGAMVVDCLRSVLAQKHRPHQVIVVDNGSSDGSLERLVAMHPDLVVVRNQRNSGFARAANQAVAAANADWLLLLNLDIVLRPDYTSLLLAAASRDSRIGSLTGKLLRPKTDDMVLVDSTGHILFRNGWAGNRGENLPDLGQWDRSEEVFGVTGAAALYRAKMLREISEGAARPFDERFFAYIEDVDLDWRMRWLGWKAWYEPTAVAIHRRSATKARRSPAILRHILKNRLLLVANNDLWPQGLARLPGVATFTVLAATQFGLEAPSSLLGLFDFVRALPGSGQRRRFLRANRRVASSTIARWMQPFPYLSQVGRRLRTGTTRVAAPPQPPAQPAEPKPAPPGGPAGPPR